MRRCALLAVLLLLIVVLSLPAADSGDVQQFLGREIIGSHVGLVEVQDYVEAHVPRMPEVKSVAEWEQHAERMRAGVLDKVVYRGAAGGWRDLPTKVEWQETIPG